MHYNLRMLLLLLLTTASPLLAQRTVVVPDSISVFASVDNSTPYTIPPSPAAASLGKYGEIPVNLSSGLPNLSIPLFSLNEGDMPWQVSLDYNYSGFRPYALPGPVANGFSLKASGVITRMIRGLPDELTSNGITGYANPLNRPKIIALMNPDGSLACQTPACQTCFYTGTCDPEPDLFYFSFGEYSGKFFFGDDGQIHVISDRMIKIEHKQFRTIVPVSNGSTDNIWSFVITTEDGSKYSFGHPDPVGPFPATPIKNVEFSWTDASSYVQRISAWYLQKAENTKFQKILFTYANDYLVNGDNINFVKTRPSTAPAQFQITRSSISSPVAVGPYPSTVTRSAENYLTGINGTNWSIVVNYNSAVAGRLVDNILLRTGSTILQKYKLDYSATGNNALLTGITEKSATDTDNRVYSLGYYGSTLPATIPYPYGIDYWGYHNGIDNGDNLIPEPPFNANRDPVFAETIRGALHTLTYPTKGLTTFTYEQNEYSYVMDSPTFNGVAIGRKPHGGIRVKTLTSTPGNGGPPVIKEYSYADFNDASLSSGVASDIPGFHSFSVGLGGYTYKLFTSEPYYQLSLSPVYYFNVRELTAGNLRTDHTFTWHKDYMDALGVNYGIMDSYVGPVKSYDFARSLPKRISRFLNNDLLDETVNTYTLSDRHVSRIFHNRPVLILSGYETNPFRHIVGVGAVSGWIRKTSETTTRFDAAIPQTVETAYTYSPSFLQLTKTSTTDSKTGTAKVTVAGQQVYDRLVETEQKYANDFTDPVSVGMVERNMISRPLETTKTLLTANAGAQVSQPLHWQKISYTLINGLFYLPQKTESKVGTAAVATTQTTFLTYDDRANLLTYLEENGASTKLEYYGTGDTGKTDLLKSSTLGSGSSIAQSGTYDYKPAVGVNATGDANAKTVLYVYDEFNRLSAATNPSGAARATYCYNYAGQPTPCTALAPAGSIAASALYLIAITGPPLPVTLVDFEAVKATGETKATLLSWSTTTETNSESFAIERSHDGRQWTKLGSVSARGESSGLQHYTFTDPAPAQGENLYRLKMLDKDGTFAYSRIRSVSFGKDAVAFYPNPVAIGEKLNLLTDDLSTISSIEMYDNQGKLMLRTAATRQINTARLAPGIYVIQINRTDGSISTHRIVKQ